jgi:hypothetical protein
LNEKTYSKDVDQVLIRRAVKGKRLPSLIGQEGNMKMVEVVSAGMSEAHPQCILSLLLGGKRIVVMCDTNPKLSSPHSAPLLSVVLMRAKRSVLFWHGMRLHSELERRRGNVSHFQRHIHHTDSVPSFSLCQ